MRCSAQDLKPKEAMQQAMALLRVLFKPSDLIEIRKLPSKKSIWLTRSAIEEHHTQSLYISNARASGRDKQTYQNIFFGINPRRMIGGRKSEDVSVCRSIVADFDHMEVDEAMECWSGAGLAEPTAIVRSGGGVHVYARLLKPVPPDVWKECQRALIHLLKRCDNKIHDPCRVLRLPGYVNHKKNVEKSKRAEIVSVSKQRRIDIDVVLKLAIDSGWTHRDYKIQLTSKEINEIISKNSWTPEPCTVHTPPAASRQPQDAFGVTGKPDPSSGCLGTPGAIWDGEIRVPRYTIPTGRHQRRDKMVLLAHYLVRTIGPTEINICEQKSILSEWLDVCRHKIEDNDIEKNWEEFQRTLAIAIAVQRHGGRKRVDVHGAACRAAEPTRVNECPAGMDSYVDQYVWLLSKELNDCWRGSEFPMAAEFVNRCLKKYANVEVSTFTAHRAIRRIMRLGYLSCVLRGGWQRGKPVVSRYKFNLHPKADMTDPSKHIVQ